ncbi:MAG: hypothetical protein MHMPM18_004811 [Marteilia pararefringens]
MKLWSVKPDASLLPKVVECLDSLVLNAENRQLLNSVLLKGALHYSSNRSSGSSSTVKVQSSKKAAAAAAAAADKCIIVLVYPKHVNILRQALQSAECHEAIQKHFNMPVFFVGQAESI